MVGPEFTSCWLKLGRAEEHLNTLKTEMGEWKESKPYTISHKSDRAGSRYGLVVEIRTPPNTDRWSLIAGDCVHNLRSALDTAVYAVAIRDGGVNPPVNADRLQFPITESPEAFEVQRARRLASLSAKAQTWIERAQPYNRPSQIKAPPLRVLSEFSNSDKHRLLNVVLQHVGDGKITFKTPLLGSVPTIHHLKTPIHSGTEFVFLTLDPPKRDLVFEFHGSFVISISHSPGPTGDHVSSLQDILTAIVGDVRSIVNGAI